MAFPGVTKLPLPNRFCCVPNARAVCAEMSAPKMIRATMTIVFLWLLSFIKQNRNGVGECNSLFCKERVCDGQNLFRARRFFCILLPCRKRTERIRKKLSHGARKLCKVERFSGEQAMHFGK